MNDVKEALDAILDSQLYLSWKEKDARSFLLSMFTLKENQWEAIFYNPSTKRSTSFALENEEVLLIGKDVEMVASASYPNSPLNMNAVNITSEDAVATARKEAEQKKVSLQSKFIVLQMVHETPCWMITFSTTELKIVRVVIDAQTGEVQDVTLQDISGMIRKV